MMKNEIKLWKEKTKVLFNIVEWTRFWSYIINLQEENQRLNNIKNELKKWLKDADVFQMNFIENKKHITSFKAVLDKLEALEERNER